MRPLPLALSTFAVLLILGCGPSADKPIPVNTQGGGGAPAGEPAAEPAADAAGAESTQPGGVNEDEAKMAGDLAAHDEAFKNALTALAEAVQQDMALAAEMKAAEAAAMEKLGGAMSEEVAEREKQAMQVAGEVINSLREKGFDVTANILTLPKDSVPEPAKALVDSLKIGDTSKIFEWNGGYGVIRKMGETDTEVKVGYIWATKEAAMGAAAAAGTTTASPDGTTTETPAGGETTTGPGAGGH